jgi:hypothetical protein
MFDNKFLFIILIGFNWTLVKAQSFNDVAAAQNIFHSAPSFDSSGGGVSFYDFDDDGWDDLTLTREDDTILFYRNNQGVFELLPITIYLAGETKHAIWVDYDNDEDNDLFVSIKNAPCRLYQNDGNFNFNDVSLQAGLYNTAGPNYGASFGDYNKDGLLDLYLCRYSDAIFNPNPLELNALYKNNGNGTFTNVASLAGVEDGIKNSFQAVWLDYDKDGWPDLYVINDKYDYYNSLYKNNGNGTFTDVTLLSGTADTIASPMTNSVADFDEDGDLDIFMTNTASPDSCRLMVNNNDGTFTNMITEYGIFNGEFTWGAAWFDAENDADLDLIVASDIATPNPRNYLYLNMGNQLFVDAPQNFQSTNHASGRSVAIGDISNDGKTDIIVNNTDSFYSYLWENTGTNNNSYIKITLTGSISNKMAIGSWIYVYTGGRKFSHYTFCGENYLGQNSQHHIFGLDQYLTVDSVVINFPSGIIDRYYNLAINQSYTFVESSLSATQINYTGALTFCDGDSIVLDAGNYSSFLWNTGANTRYLTVHQSGNYWVDVTTSLGTMLFSDTLLIEVVNSPQISINAQNISCDGLSDGSIILDIVNQTNDFTVTWNLGLQGDTINNLAAGNYTYEYNDIYGCYYTDSINILSPYAMFVFYQITPYSAIGMGEISSIINGGTPPYEIYLDSVLQGILIDSLLPGYYYYQVFDASGCSYSNTLEIVDYTAVGISSESSALFKFKNPMVDNQLQIFTLEKITKIDIYNTIGQLIPSKFENNVLQLEEDYHGVIFLKIIANERENNFKLVKL